MPKTAKEKAETQKAKKTAAAKPAKKEAKAVKAEKPVKEKAAPKTKKAEKLKEQPVAETQIPHAEKLEIIEKFQVKEGDTGSPEVQAALLTKRIEKLVAHLKSNPSDNHSRRGLLGIVSKRRRLLNYLEKKDKSRYQEIITKLNLSK